MSKDQTATLYGNEERWKPVALVAVVLSTLLDAYLLAVSTGSLPVPLWLVFALLCIVLLLINLRCLFKNGPTVGMIPIAFFSMSPATLMASRVLIKYSAPWWACVCVTATSLAAMAFFAAWYRRIEHAYDRPVDLRNNTVLVVLGGLVRDGEPTPTVAMRLAVAARLWREAPGRTIVVTGGPVPDGSTTEADAMAQWLQTHEGVPAEAILLEPRAKDTRQNVEFSLELLEQQGLAGRQVCLVTSNYHLFRALALAHRIDPAVVGVTAPVPDSSYYQQWCREVMTIVVMGIEKA